MMNANEQPLASSRNESGMMERLEKMRMICEEKIKKKDSLFMKIHDCKKRLERKEAEKLQRILELCASDAALADIKATSGTHIEKTPTYNN